MPSFLKESKLSSQPKVALVHDDFCQAGGAESLFATIASLYPDAPIYTSIVNWYKLPPSIDPDRIKTSWMQKIPLATKFYKILLPLYPLAFESFDFSQYDLVISSTTRFAKAIITKPNTVHICYVNSLPRFLWDEKAVFSYWPLAFRVLSKFYINWLKRWDKVAASRVDRYIANSKNVAEKIKKVYARESAVIYPFADTNFFRPAKIHNWPLKSQNYFLIVSRLVEWKKIEIAIEAALDLGINLKIVGTGPDEKRLRKIKVKSQKSKVRSKIEFIGRITRGELRELYQNAKALIITQEEDFGIAAIEAQACGIPLIAYRAGGVSEIVLEGKTGLFYEKQTAESLKDAISRLSELKWEVKNARSNALKFSKHVFVKEFKETINLYASE